MTFEVYYRKIMRNPLLDRLQMVVDVKHSARVKNKNNVSLFGFKTDFGGSKSTGFCLIYNDEKSRTKFEPKYRLRRLKLLEERTGSAKQKKEKKNKLKKLRAKAKREAQK